MNGFRKKVLVQGRWASLCMKILHPHNSGSTLRIVFKFCSMKGAVRKMKMTLIVFSEKNLVQCKLAILGSQMINPCGFLKKRLFGSTGSF